MARSKFGVGIPQQANIPIDAILPLFNSGLIWQNWNSNRNSQGTKLSLLWRPVPGDDEWLRFVEWGKKYWEQSNHRWWLMPLYAIPLFWNEPESSGQSNVSPQEAVRVTRQWASDTGGAPFGGFSNLHSMANSAGLRWRQEYARLGGIDPVVEAFHVYAFDGPGIIGLMADILSAVYTGQWGSPTKPVWFTEVGAWGPTDTWTPTPERVMAVMDAAAAMTTVGADLVLWFSTRYAGNNGWWAANDLVTADGSALTQVGKRWAAYVNGTRAPSFKIHLANVAAPERELQ